MQTMRVHLGSNSYDISIGRGLLSAAGDIFRPVFAGDKVLVVTDDHVGPLYADAVCRSLTASGFDAQVLTLPAGEETKCMASMMRVYSALNAFHITRKDALIALGGGVMGDLAGFAAATYLRGIPFGQIPTSLLAQVDSSVGGKVAVDLPEGKNLAGSFYQPKAVLIDPDVLDTLTDRYLRDGMGEVIKYAWIRDKVLYDILQKAGAPEKLRSEMENIIWRCLDIKRQMVENDERDTGERMLLNFGHTLGHAAETAQHFSGYSHGEAVALGMHVITRISEQKGMTVSGSADKIQKMLEMYHLPVTCSRSLLSDMRRALLHDKKNMGSALNVVLVKDIGESFVYKTNPDFFAEVETWLN